MSLRASGDKLAGTREVQATGLERLRQPCGAHVFTGQMDGHAGGAEVDVASLDPDQLRALAVEMRTVLRAREEQMERMMEESSSLREVAKQLQVTWVTWPPLPLARHHLGRCLLLLRHKDQDGATGESS
jgi:hypothetical protein